MGSIKEITEISLTVIIDKLKEDCTEPIIKKRLESIIKIHQYNTEINPIKLAEYFINPPVDPFCLIMTS